jgi:hypothetical protein
MTKWFSSLADPHLFHCACGRAACDAPPPSALLLANLDQLRDRRGAPVTVDSGPRCAFWNLHEGGTVDPPSGHLDGSEVDVACETSGERDQLLEAVYAAPRLFLRVGIGRTFLHLGTSPRLAQRVAWLYP